MKSLWEQTAELNHFDCLDGDIKTDYSSSAVA